MMKFLFGGKQHEQTPEELLVEKQSLLELAMQEMDRERMSLQMNEKSITLEIKKLARQGQMGAVQVLAKSFIQNKNAITKMYKCKATLQAVSHQLSSLNSTAQMANAMCGATTAMRVMSEKLNLPGVRTAMKEFEKQSIKLGNTREMLDDAFSRTMENEDDAEETEMMVQSVYDEIGIASMMQLGSAPSARGGGQETTFIGEDNQARLDTLRGL